jgi:indole-3-glycerol phosphate synthase
VAARPFAAALRRARAVGKTGIIAEIKARTAEGEELLGSRSAASLAHSYAAGGATCLSVVTGRWFGGTPALLEEVARASALPILCKDFIRSVADVKAAAGRGASAVLLTLKILPVVAVQAVLEACREERIDPFVEVSNEAELERACALAVELVAINNKDIQSRERTGEGIDRSLRLLGGRGGERLWVSASSISSAGEAGTLARAGFDALLVGTHLMRAQDPRAETRALAEAAQARPLVKVCGVRDERELEALKASGVDLIGIARLPGEPYHLELPEARRLAAGCRDGLRAVLVTTDRDAARISAEVQEIAPAAVQLAGFTGPRQVAELRAAHPGVALIQVVHARAGKLIEGPHLAEYAEAGVDLFLLDRVGDGRVGSTGEPIDGETIAAFERLSPPRPWLLAGGLDAASVAGKLHGSGALGVDVLSSVREGGARDRPIDPARVTDFVRAVRGP